MKRQRNPIKAVIGDRRHEERPHGWALSALMQLVNEAGLLAQEAWMIDPLSWEFAAPNDLSRRPLRELVELAFGASSYTVSSRMGHALAATGPLLSIFGAITNRNEKEFVADRQLMARTQKLGSVLTAFREILIAIPREEREGLDSTGQFLLLQNLALQEASLEPTDKLLAPTIDLAPARGPEPDPRALALEWARLAGQLGVALEAARAVKLPAMQQAGLSCPLPREDYDLRAEHLQALGHHLVDLPQKNPVQRWIAVTLEDSFVRGREMLPGLARCAFHVLLARDAARDEPRLLTEETPSHPSELQAALLWLVHSTGTRLSPAERQAAYRAGRDAAEDELERAKAVPPAKKKVKP